MGSQATFSAAIVAGLTAIHNFKDLRDTALASRADLPDFRRDQTAHADTAEHFSATLRTPTEAYGVVARVAKYSVGTICHFVSFCALISRFFSKKQNGPR